MPRRDDIEELFEFRIRFRHLGSDFVNDRHFTSKDVQSAINMFEFACRKDDLEVEIASVDKWNRWSDRWERVEQFVQKEADLVS